MFSIGTIWYMVRYGSKKNLTSWGCVTWQCPELPRTFMRFLVPFQPRPNSGTTSSNNGETLYSSISIKMRRTRLHLANLDFHSGLTPSQSAPGLHETNPISTSPPKVTYSSWRVDGNLVTHNRKHSPQVSHRPRPITSESINTLHSGRRIGMRVLIERCLLASYTSPIKRLAVASQVCRLDNVSPNASCCLSSNH